VKILIIKTSSLGDVIHLLPAISDAAKARPDLRIDWLVEESFVAIPAWHPAVQQVIPMAMRRWKRTWRQASTWQAIQQTRQRLKAESYELVIDAQGLLKSAGWCVGLKSPCAGYDRESAREPLAALFYDQKFNVAKAQHAVDRNRQLLAKAMGYALDEPAPDYGLQGLLDLLPAIRFETDQPFIMGLHGTSRADKLWPLSCWQALAVDLSAKNLGLMLPWGNEEERLRAEAIAEGNPLVKVLPRLDLNALARLIGQSVAVVGVDTGLLHLAAALGKPGAALYTATPPALTGAVLDRGAAGQLTNLSKPNELGVTSVVRAIEAAVAPH